ncbi:SDR family oxidoreductase [Flavihumibacter fluvii]|uniref:SDR family oxidoreductase n=1 Tax=Flavihumibacter fluvii TaxID=2838157 RepID=UPI001BDDE5F4|nr:SDR family oxidoreductase [Flavihumibacter fluvii]ULQ52069.1 SDR family oxidoreductase [Flavihumibacter fluvii]
MSKTILITGATGQLGKATIDFLLKKGATPASISALVRDPAKAEDLKAKGIQLKLGDYNDYASLLAAFEGTDKLLLISGNDLANRAEQQANAVNAAREAGVKHIIYTSFFRKNESAHSPIYIVAKSHMETEKAVKASGIPYTIMLNSLYADILPMFMGEKVLETGVFLPAGDGKASYTTRQDMAEAAANILSTEGHENKSYIVANDATYTLYDVARILGELTGKKISNINPAAEVYIDTLSKAGVPVEYVGMFAGFSEAIKQGEFDTSASDLEKLIGRKPTSLKEYFASVYTS